MLAVFHIIESVYVIFKCDHHYDYSVTAAAVVCKAASKLHFVIRNDLYQYWLSLALSLFLEDVSTLLLEINKIIPSGKVCALPLTEAEC